MSEGRYWNCRWEPKGEGFRAWVVARPKLHGTGRDWQSTLDALCNRIGNATGDGEPNLRFDPPEPVTGNDGQWVHPDWVQLQAQGGLPLTDESPDLFTKGFCPHCREPRGERTRVRLRATGPADADMCWPWGFGVTRYLPVMLSERFLALWSRSELRKFRLLPVIPAPRSRTRYVECIPKELVRPVAVRGWTIDGDHCPVCGRDWFMCTSEREVNFSEGQIQDWCCTADLPARGRYAVAFGSAHDWHFLLPVERARQLCRHRYGSGARIGRIGAVPPSMVLSKLRLPRALKRK